MSIFTSCFDLYSTNCATPLYFLFVNKNNEVVTFKFITYKELYESPSLFPNEQKLKHKQIKRSET